MLLLTLVPYRRATALTRLADTMFRRRFPPVPHELCAYLPAHERACPAMECEGGVWAVAGMHAFILVGHQGVTSAGMWHEVQTAKWDADSHLLTVTWTDPSVPPVEATSLPADPTPFMQVLRQRIESTHVLHRAVRCTNGTFVVAQIRRGPNGGLFCVLTADGPLDSEGQARVSSLEREVCEEVGLE